MRRHFAQIKSRFAAEAPPLRARTMDHEERIWIRDGLTEPAGGVSESVESVGYLIGLSHSNIAEAFSEKFQKPLTVGAVRRYLKRLRERGAPIAKPVRGRPSGTTTWSNSTVRLCAELLFLTGWSTTALHEKLSEFIPVSALPGKRTFQSRLKEASVKRSKRSRSSEAKRTLVELCTVRLHQIAMRFPNGTYRVVQLAYERHTEFIHAALHELKIEVDLGESPPAQPHKIQAFIYQGCPHERVVLDQELWQSFYKETTGKLGLPVTRFEYFADFGLTPSSWPHGGVTVQLEKAGQELAESQCFEVAGPLWTEVLGSLATTIMDYNEARFSGVVALREQTRQGWMETRRKQGIRLLKPPFEERQRYQLEDYYKGMDKPTQLQLRAISKPKKVYASRRTAGGSQATESSEGR